MISRKQTRELPIGHLKIGGTNPILVQSMCNTKTQDVEATVKQISRLAAEGCEMVRIAVKDMGDVQALADIKKLTSAKQDSVSVTNRQVLPSIPLIADIHFDVRIAIAAIDAGADKIRLNPGNTKDFWQAADYAKAKNIPFRIGFNSGSSTGFDYSMLDRLQGYPVVLAAKSTDVTETIESYRKLSSLTSAPLHVGVTEAGTLYSGSIKSAVGIGAILAEGIGDTIRVSLAGDPVAEIDVAYKILRALGLRKRGVEVIACPTCGRTNIEVEKLAKDVEEATKHILMPLKIAVMGCGVNGPGEARMADYGIAGGCGEGLLFAKGQIVKKVKESELIKELLVLINA